MDILPAGPDELAAGYLVWPESGRKMTLTGSRLVFESAVELSFEGNVLRVAPVEVIAPLKMAAYQDRGRERERDLEDLGHILEEFVPSDAEERCSDEIIAQGLSYEEVSPFLAGRRLSEMVNETERHLVSTFISRVENEEDPDQTRAMMAMLGPYNGDVAGVLRAIRAFKRGFQSGG